MKTAVEWLYEQMPKKIQPHYKKQLDQAKEMEKVQDLQQWIETWSLGYNSGWDNCIKKFKQQEQ